MADSSVGDNAKILLMNESDVQRDHYAAIGRVAAAWSLLEAVIDTESIHVAKSRPEFGICFTSQVAGIGRKLDAYISLSRLHKIPQTLIKELCDFDKDTKSLGERRNRIVHDVWLFSDPTRPERLEASARKIVKLTAVPVPTTELINLWAEICWHIDRFEKLAADVRAGSASSPDTSKKDIPA